jgi:hypothetical protein
MIASSRRGETLARRCVITRVMMRTTTATDKSNNQRGDTILIHTHDYDQHTRPTAVDRHGLSILYTLFYYTFTARTFHWEQKDHFGIIQFLYHIKRKIYSTL